MTQVIVRFYKPSGKLYTADQFETTIETFENNLLRAETKRRFKMCDEFSYVIIASKEVHSNQQAVNEFLTIVHETKEGYTPILAQAGSLIITPEELEAFKYFNINIAGILEKIQAYMKKFM